MKLALILAVTLLPGAGFAACDPVPDPVVRLDYGSRYADDSKTRSDFDDEGNAEVDAALKPVDQFIIDLAKSK